MYSGATVNFLTLSLTVAAIVVVIAVSVASFIAVQQGDNPLMGILILLPLACIVGLVVWIRTHPNDK